jgi:hypothetical protein
MLSLSALLLNAFSQQVALKVILAKQCLAIRNVHLNKVAQMLTVTNN